MIAARGTRFAFPAPGWPQGEKGERMDKRMLGFGALLVAGWAAGACAQAVPTAPPVPTCSMADGLSDCRFKSEMSGTPTSVVGHQVILFRYSKSGGHGTSRTYLDNALKRLAARYNFTANITEDPTVFTNANLANTRVVIMSNGDGDVIAPGPNRTALENFNQVSGWGVIWIHAACAFITSAWPYGQNSCVQLFYDHDPVGTPRRVFLDSGTRASPNHGIKNPQSEFLLRNLPGWNGSRTFAMSDEYYCPQAPARNTANVNVLLGYDRSSGLPPGDCPSSKDASEAASQIHNLAWAHMMGQGISLYNSIGHDEDTYTAGSNMGDSLLWRFIRYAAKDWERGPSSAIKAHDLPGDQIASGPFTLDFADPARNVVGISDISGKRVFERTYAGESRAEIPALQRGIYYVRVSSRTAREIRKVRIL
jgi:hypothetical protein